jgi:hypothetical protein
MFCEVSVGGRPVVVDVCFCFFLALVTGGFGFAEFFVELGSNIPASPTSVN